MDVQMKSWGEVTDEIRHESPTLEKAMEIALFGGIEKALTRYHLQNKDFYLHLMLRVNLNPHAVTPEMSMVVVPVMVDHKEVYATCIFRNTLPIPGFEESVYKFDHRTGDPIFLWHIPVKGMHDEYVRNYKMYIQDPALRRQAKTCLEFHTGALAEWVKKQNNEDPEKEGYFLKYTPNQESAIIH